MRGACEIIHEEVEGMIDVRVRISVSRVECEEGGKSFVNVGLRSGNLSS